MVIDADGLFLLNNNIDLICGHSNVILTPNAIEFRRLFGEDIDVIQQKISLLGDGIVILKKVLMIKFMFLKTTKFTQCLLVVPDAGVAVKET